MKKILFGLVATVMLSFSGFKATAGTIDCKWRTGIRSGGVTYWSEWAYGSCNVTESGKLIPVQ